MSRETQTANAFSLLTPGNATATLMQSHCNIVVATKRLLNFFSQASKAGMPSCGDTLEVEGQARTALESPSKVCKSVQPPSQTEEGQDDLGERTLLC